MINATNILCTPKKIQNARFVIPNMVKAKRNLKRKSPPKADPPRAEKNGLQKLEKNLSKSGGMIIKKEI